MRIVIYSAEEQTRSRLHLLAVAWATLVCAELTITVWEEIPSLPLDEGGVFFLDTAGTKSPQQLYSFAEHIAVRKDCALFLCVENSRAAIRCYALHPYGVLCRPFCPEDLLQAMGRCINLWWSTLRRLELLSDRTKIHVPLYDLVWIESVPKGCMLHCTDFEAPVRLRLSALESMLPEKVFLRCQRSFVVNLCHIRSAEKNEITLTGGTSLPLGRDLRHRVLEAYETVRLLRAGDATTMDAYENDFCRNL